ncbi:MAG: nitrile hydratase subunit beta [Paracoccaceae bacterium]
MDGIHDLGGKQGFGPIPIGDNEGFHHDWEERMWAMARCGILPPGTAIDQFRHGLERMVPTDYLSFAYFNKWCANYFMFYLNAGTFTNDEVLNGHCDTPSDPAKTLSLDQVVAAQRALVTDFSEPTDAQPRFAIGDTVTTKRRITANHTRLPGYARNAAGTVITHHGAHLLADFGAEGIHQAQHLYTVSFMATELWGEDANPIDTVTLELWESYLV